MKISPAKIDEAARAIYLVGEDWDAKDGFGQLPDYAQDYWRDRARAAAIAFGLEVEE